MGHQGCKTPGRSSETGQATGRAPLGGSNKPSHTVPDRFASIGWFRSACHGTRVLSGAPCCSRQADEPNRSVRRRPTAGGGQERFRWFQSLGNKLHGDGRASPGVRGRRVCKSLRIRRLLQMASRILAAKPSAGVALPPEQDRVSRWALPSPRVIRCRQVEWSRSPTGDGNDPVLYHCSTQLGRIGEIGSTEPW